MLFVAPETSLFKSIVKSLKVLTVVLAILLSVGVFKFQNFL